MEQQAGKYKDLLVRIISALVMLPVAVSALWFGGWALALLLIIGGYLMLVEWFGLVKVKLGKATKAGSAAISLGLVLYWYVPENLIGGLFFFCGMGFLTAGAVRTTDFTRSLKWIVLGVVYVALPLLSIAYIRDAAGFTWVMWLFLVVWATDVGGYFAGRTIGGPKLMPKISPKKTWAGLLGGMTLSVIVTWIMMQWAWLTPIPLFPWAALLLPVWAQVGDMLESALKRHYDIKDSGSIIPGHGGILDRVDGLVFVAPVVALMFGQHYQYVM